MVHTRFALRRPVTTLMTFIGRSYKIDGLEEGEGGDGDGGAQR